MKKLIILIAMISLVACNTKETVTESTLSGTIENLGDVPVLLFMGQEIDTINVSEDGTYSITKDLEKAKSFNLRIGRSYSPIYLAPGYNLIANFDAEDLQSTIKYDGDLALENRYTKEFMGLNSELNQGMRELYMATPDEYKEGVLKIKTAQSAFLKNYQDANPDLCPEFAEKEKITYEFNYYSSLSNYEPAHKYYAQVDEVALPDDWYDFEKDIALDNPKYLDIPVAMRVVGTLIGKKIVEEGGPGEDAWGTSELLDAQFSWVLKNISDQDMINHFLISNLSSILDYAGPDGIEEYIDTYYEKSTDQKSIDEVKAKVETWAHLRAGNMAPAFTLPDIEGNEVSLSDFEGKYVYIDFWATWCGPCKIEIPVLEELSVKYADKNIEIISISVDQDKQAWIDMVREDKPQWLQLHDGINMNDDYLVRFIPTFVLIDREGKILKARAPRPSEGEVLEDLFNSLEGI